ncbi:MAG: exosortase/archaeosortase family protein [Planctomycetes bacterium]|nr:exosortase/archaeosortase family protein [Planctomycetota bacterium]
MKVVHAPAMELAARSSARAASPEGAGITLRTQAICAAAALTLAFLWCFWPSLRIMAQRWSNDPQYSHGFLVPVFALVVLWSRRHMLAGAAWQPAWFGLPVLASGIFLKLVAAQIDLDPLDTFSLLPTLTGLGLFVGGWNFLRWCWPALAFLAFMVPLPFQIEIAMAHPLRRLATGMSTYLLQTLGYPAVAEGNIILIGQSRLGVAEACSGLGMLMTFFALATAMALVIRAPLLDRLVLVASAVPIAVIANVVRITATGAAGQMFGDETADWIMHDLAGWLMMPFALLVLWLEMLYLARLLPLRAIQPSRPLFVGGVRSR